MFVITFLKKRIDPNNKTMERIPSKKPLSMTSVSKEIIHSNRPPRKEKFTCIVADGSWKKFVAILLDIPDRNPK